MYVHVLRNTEERDKTYSKLFPTKVIACHYHLSAIKNIQV